MWADTLKEQFKYRLRRDEVILKECPFCSNDNYNIEFSMSKNVFHCWVCGAKGTVYSFFKLYNLPLDDIDWQSSTPIRQERQDSLFIDGFVSIEYDEWPRFFKKRGLIEEDIKRYNLLTGTKGRYFQTMVIPLYEGRRLVYFVARELLGFKYKNPVIERRNIIPYFMGDTNRLELVLCEGALDAISVNKVGFTSGVLLGKFFSNEQMRRLKRFGFDKVVVALDGDAIKQAIILADRLSELGIRSRIARFNDGDDPNSLYVKSPSLLKKTINEAHEFSVREKAEIAMGGR